jgi:hypothetical protein
VRVLLAVVPLLLAGCSSAAGPPALGGGDGGGDGPGERGERVEGVVVSAAIVPLEGVALALVPGGRAAVSDAGGRFAFDGVAPGEYFVAATRPGYIPAQAVVLVEDGRPPPLVQLVMDADRSLSPYVEGHAYRGYLDVSFRLGPAAGSGGGIFGEPALGTWYTVASRLPDWVQAEMVWSASQGLARNMLLSVSPQNGSAVITVSEDAEGPSPLAVGLGRGLLEEWGLEGGSPLAVSAFVGNNSPPPAPAAGLAVAQGFDLYTHLFYGYLPPEGWRFTAAGTPPPPA